MFEAILAGFGIGMAGSLHCVGMCGPLALSLPISGRTEIARVLAVLLYNLGRTATYFTMGLALGWASHRLAFAGYQQIASVTMGAIILALLLLKKLLPGNRWTGHLRNGVRKWLRYFLVRRNSAGTFFVIGLLNGALPCGTVYIAIAAALTTGSAFRSGLLMIAFGLGTLPLMALLMLCGHHLSLSWKTRFRKAAPLFIAGVAVLMVLRGLNLGIPFVSPAFSGTEERQFLKCHPPK
ncbi:sulfite exporter TauE/SafE family protein [Chitinophaga sp. NPDC101104]|uniref:sulfite exporter TauE/SafE family protein n=1 Tax=Chitinophaga sp. NPDC101104 TaxID=3390561 RepID=UPI003D0197F0